MARIPRIEYPSAFYHVLSRGQERKNIFRSSGDRKHFLELLEESIVRHQIRVYAYCLMDNHYHLLLETLDSNLSRAMKYINGSYATYFNAKWKRVGHVFASRYKAILVEKDSYLMELSRYIHLNPVRAKMVKMPEDFRWSSYSGYIGLGNEQNWVTSQWLLKQFGGALINAQRQYKKFVEKGIDNKAKDPLKEIVAGMILGRETFVDHLRRKLDGDKSMEENKNDKWIQEMRKLKKYPELKEIKTLVDLDERMNHRKKLKTQIYLSQKYSDKNLTEIGKYFGYQNHSSVSMLLKRFSLELMKEKELALTLKTLEEKLQLIHKM